MNDPNQLQVCTPFWCNACGWHAQIDGTAVTIVFVSDNVGDNVPCWSYRALNGNIIACPTLTRYVHEQTYDEIMR